MVEIGAARHAPRQVLGDERRLEALDQSRQPLEMRGVEPVRAAEREPHPMDRHRVVGAQPLERAPRRAAAHVVLGVDLQPGDGGAALEDLRHVRGAQTDAAASRMHGALKTHDPCPAVRVTERPTEVS